MHRVCRWMRPVLWGAFGLLAGCAAQDQLVTPAVSGPSASHASYAYSTAYGEMWEVGGEVLPAGSGQPWNAVINTKKTWVDFTSGCRSCDVDFMAEMTGMWNSTRQTISWSVDNRSGTEPKTRYGWTCDVRLTPLYCALAKQTDEHAVFVDNCAWTAAVSGYHEAWWGAFFDFNIGDKRVGQFGLTSANSTGKNVTVDVCGATSGGGDGSGGVCYDYYLVWTDWKGYHEVYLYSRCWET